MKINNILLLVLFFMTNIIFGQSVVEKEIHGKINVDSTAVEGVNIINSSTQKTTITDKNGAFLLLVKEGDILIFSAVNLETLHRKINKQDFILNAIKIQMIIKPLILKEVVVNKDSEITAENLGIIPYGQKKYTPAERKLKTAGDFKPIHLFGLLGGALAIDPIINKINGRTTMLKKALEVEKKEIYLKQLDNLFDRDYFVNKLKIPAEYVKGFEYYIVENEKFVAVLKSKNKTAIEFLLGELAVKYNEIISGENK